MTTNSSIENEALGKVSRHAHWLLRFALASVFLYMGVDKFMGGGISEFAEIMALSYPIAVLVPLAEIGAGVFIIAGAIFGAVYGTLITRLGALAAIPVLLGAIFMVHWGQWHFMATPTHPLGGMMFQVTLVMLALYMLIRGNEA